MSATAIEWATHVWNPVTGCTKVSPGCKHCYAETVAKRFWKGRKFTDVRCHPERLQEPRRWRKPRRVFVNSMSDLFHEDVPDSFIEHVYDSMATFDQHDFLVLTKRPERMRAFMVAQGKRERAAGGRLFPHKNVWLGVSVEDQQRADERIPVLLDTPASVRFLSCEPLLGPVILHGPGLEVDWVIVGGESGPGARPCDVDWVRSIVAQCQTCQVPVFVKQMGRWVLGDDAGFRVNHWLISDGKRTAGFCPPIIGENAFKRPRNAIGFSLFDPKGGKPEQWPEDLRVREFPR